MKSKLVLITLALLAGMANAQDFVSSKKFALPDAPGARTFWTPENKIDFTIFAAQLTADAITTQRGLNQHYREVNPIARPFVTQGAAGEAAFSALSFGATVGAAYFLHKTHHDKAQRIAMRLLLAGEGAVVAHNIAALR
ncbi:MAG TPA: DUF5658 family protein [Terriglobales bacterium]|nr:DUF5658 family protein [Terriglobales bacterium]